MDDMFDIQHPMMLFLLISMRMESYGLSFEDVSDPLMVAIYTSPRLLLSKVFIGTGKAFFPKTVFSYAIFTCSSHIFSQAGKALQQIDRKSVV